GRDRGFDAVAVHDFDADFRRPTRNVGTTGPLWMVFIEPFNEFRRLQMVMDVYAAWIVRHDEISRMRLKIQGRARSPANACANHRAVEVEIFDAAVGCEVVGKVTPAHEYVVAAEAAPGAREGLPGQIGIAGADVAVILDEPFVLSAE